MDSGSVALVDLLQAASRPRVTISPSSPLELWGSCGARGSLVSPARRPEPRFPSRREALRRGGQRAEERAESSPARGLAPRRTAPGLFLPAVLPAPRCSWPAKLAASPPLGASPQRQLPPDSVSPAPPCRPLELSVRVRIPLPACVPPSLYHSFHPLSSLAPLPSYLSRSRYTRTPALPLAMSDTNASAIDQILEILKSLQTDQNKLAAAVDAVNGRVNALSDIKELKDNARPAAAAARPQLAAPASPSKEEGTPPSEVQIPRRSSTTTASTSRVILTTYPGQGGVDPVIMNWGEQDPEKRGPVVVGRGSSTIRRRNGESHGIVASSDEVKR